MNGCPVCRAGFRGVTVCPRCGADLAPLMVLAVRAYRLRQAARDALAAEDFAAAKRLAAMAERIQATPAGHGLNAVSAWLEQCRPAGPRYTE